MIHAIVKCGDWTRLDQDYETRDNEIVEMIISSTIVDVVCSIEKNGYGVYPVTISLKGDNLDDVYELNKFEDLLVLMGEWSTVLVDFTLETQSQHLVTSEEMILAAELHYPIEAVDIDDYDLDGLICNGVGEPIDTQEITYLESNISVDDIESWFNED